MMVSQDFSPEKLRRVQILYMSPKYAALGMKRFSDDAQRLQNGYLDSIRRTNGRHRAFTRLKSSTRPTLLTSVFQWGSASGLSLIRNAARMGGGRRRFCPQPYL